MLQKIISVSFFLFIGLLATVNGQTNASQGCEEYSKGTIFFKNGRSKKAYILMDYCNPEKFQQGLLTIREADFKAFESSKYSTTKLVKRHRANDILDLILEDGREFRYVKYKDVGVNPKHGSTYKKLLLEVLTDGDIVVYKKRYNSESAPIENKDSFRGQLEFMNSNFELFVQKSWRKDPVNVRDVNLEEYLGDNYGISSKYSRFNLLKQEPVFNKNCDNAFLFSLLELVSDYNGEVKTGYTNTTFFEDEY